MKKHWLQVIPAALAVGSLAVAAACSSNSGLPHYYPAGGGGGGGTAGGGGNGNPGGNPGAGAGNGGAPSQPVTTPAVWVRGDLRPEYELVSTRTYGQFDPLGVNVGASVNGISLKGIDNSDFTTQNLASSNQKTALDAIEAFINSDQDPGIAKLATPFYQPNDPRPPTIPMRGKPSDVKIVSPAQAPIGQTELFVPLGGTFEVPWNEVAILPVTGTTAGAEQSVTVGLKPERLAVHPTGLVFVCNQYSNYISIIDPRSNSLLRNNNVPVVLPTEFFCSDIVFAPTESNTANESYMIVANRWRHSIIKYHIRVDTDSGATGQPSNVEYLDHPNGDTKLDFLGFETNTGDAGPNPRRLALSQDQTEVYVANGAGGDVARFSIGGDNQVPALLAHTSIPATTMDIVNIGDTVYIPSSMIDRGLLASDQSTPTSTNFTPAPVKVTGLDGKTETVNQGALFDQTHAYNFEDVRNGLVSLDYQLGGSISPTGVIENPAQYYTDDVSPEANYSPQQKILTGGLGQSIVKNAAGTLLFVANAGNDNVQSFNVNTGAQFSLTPAQTFQTRGHIPYGLALDEAQNQLYVTDWGSDEVEIISLANGTSTPVSLDFTAPTYPATNVERGEFNFVNEAWSNNGRKSCASCHEDWQWGGDGLSFDNGAAAPVTEHRVKNNANIADTGAYFWNGSFLDNNYASLAFDAQTKDNCRLIEFGIVEGIGSIPATRQGDPKNVSFNQADVTACQPVEVAPPVLGFVANEQQILDTSKIEQGIVAQNIQNVTGLANVTQQGQTFPLAAAQAREELNREIDLYTVSQLRLPPNPESYLFSTPVPGQSGSVSQLSSTDYASVQNGQNLFNGKAGCSGCHVDSQGLYVDNMDHGPGADWLATFVSHYSQDPRITTNEVVFSNPNIPNFQVPGLGGEFPQVMTDVLALNYPSSEGHAINTYLYPIDFFIPFCFDTTNCLEFDDPLEEASGGQQGSVAFAEESRRLALILQFNLENTDRQFNPGLMVGGEQEVAANTASLRGVWTQSNYLHHGYARSIREAILGPGHPALQQGETGYAYDANAIDGQNYDVHGVTQHLSTSDVNDLVNFVQTIQ